MRASSGAASSRVSTLMMPPLTEDTAAMPSARPASPLSAMGYPSNAVATAGGAPGALISTAVMEPPNVPAQYNADNSAIAGTGSKYRENGSSSATPMDDDRPGSAPMITPATVPATIRAQHDRVGEQ